MYSLDLIWYGYMFKINCIYICIVSHQMDWSIWWRLCPIKCTHYSHLLCPWDKSSYFAQFRCVCGPRFLSHQDCYPVDIGSILYTLSHGMQVDWFHCLLTLVPGWQSYRVMVHLSWQVISLWPFCLLLLDVEYSCISHYSKSEMKQIDNAIIIRNQEFHLETKNIFCWLRKYNYNGHKLFFAKKIKVMFSSSSISQCAYPKPPK